MEAIDFGQIVTWNFVVIALVAGVLGAVIKAIEVIPNNLIPLINLAVAVVVSMLWLGLGVESFVCGVLASVAASGFYELFKQFLKTLGVDSSGPVE